MESATDMGIDIVTARFLCFCREAGVDFARSATLGRQYIYVDKLDFEAFLRRSHIYYSSELLDLAFDGRKKEGTDHVFADELFRILGASSLDAIDASDYEGASIIADMNLPIDPKLYGQYTALIDGGTLEHIFNFPVAIDNCMKMLRKGGSFMSIAPANNFFGHGFYQFSSELFYRVFSEENGFKVRHVFLCGEKDFQTWYAIKDPKFLRRRVAHYNNVPTFQLFLAEKISEDAGLKVPPQQSDYSDILWSPQKGAEWTAHGIVRNGFGRTAYRLAIGFIPRRWRHVLRKIKPRVLGSIKAPFRHEDLTPFKP